MKYSSKIILLSCSIFFTAAISHAQTNTQVNSEKTNSAEINDPRLQPTHIPTEEEMNLKAKNSVEAKKNIVAQDKKNNTNADDKHQIISTEPAKQNADKKPAPQK